MSTAVNLGRLMWTCWKLNLAGAMEFRLSFLLTAGMMLLNNVVWIFFWGVYFNRFPVVNGWSFADVMMMWAVATTGFGLSATLFGNSLRIASLVSTGDLDTFLAQPKPVLPHVLVSRMSVTAIGDFLFGVLVYLRFGDVSLVGALKFAAAALLAMLIYVFFHVLTQSLAFFIGNAEGLGYQFFVAFITFSTYPSDIFRGFGKVLLFTALPAGFISYMPIGFLRGFDAPFMAAALTACAVLTAAGTGLFYAGLRRYSSGNRIGARM